MFTGKFRLIIVASIAAVLGWTVISPVVQGNYDVEVQPQISVGGYQSDTAKMIDSYERLMGNYQKLMAENFTNVDKQLITVKRDIALIRRDIGEIKSMLAQVVPTGVRAGEPKPQPNTIEPNEPNATVSSDYSADKSTQSASWQELEALKR